MIIYLHNDFEKRYSKLNKKEREKCKTRLNLFRIDPFSPLLNNHPLHGIYEGYRSINIGGDLRAIYKLTQKDVAMFIAIGTHAHLYE